MSATPDRTSTVIMRCVCEHGPDVHRTGEILALDGLDLGGGGGDDRWAMILGPCQAVHCECDRYDPSAPQDGR